MRVIVVGLGVQGRKRLHVASEDCVATVDPLVSEADAKSLTDVSPDSFDAALVCVPDAEKPALLAQLLGLGKHVLVEKPLLAEDEASLHHLAELARANRVICYTAYNHRFEPHFVRMRDVIASGRLGKIYLARLFYANGTAREVRSSVWRDQGGGILPDLGSHLLDTVLFWFGEAREDFQIDAAHRFENRAFDHVAFRSQREPVLELEATLLSWRNHLTVDVYGEKGSAHIESLCKWGPSTFRLRTRVLPAGRPPEEAQTLIQPDPTWQAEYAHFKRLFEQGGNHGLENDIWINRTLTALTRDALERFPA